MNASDGYEYDVFVSYSRTPNVSGWVCRHFAPRLHDYLVDELDREPRIFLDVEQEVGVRWPDNLARALMRSHLMVAVWSPPYFRSRWCLAEWHTFRRREEMLKVSGPVDPMGLVLPVRYSDGRHFHPDARDTQQETSFKDYNYPDEQFEHSPKYLDFRDAVRRFAGRLAVRLDDPPPWQPDWPIERPDTPNDPPPAPMPRLY